MEHCKHRSGRRAHLFGIAAACLSLLAACASTSLFRPHTVDNMPDAGSFHLAVLSVAPWNNFIDKLQPKFELTETEALKRVLPTVQSVEEKLLDALLANLKVGLPTSSFSETTTRNATGEITTTGTSTRGSSTPPALSTDSPAGTRTAAGLPGLTDRTIDTDPVLQYSAATALLQEVRLLNSYVENAALFSETIPYLVRLQLSAMPFARNEPYDLYADLSFFPDYDPDKNDTKLEQPPLVIPLLATDNLTTTQRSRAVDLVRQYGLALGGSTPGVAAQAELKRLSDDLKSVIGRDLDSVFTVARLADNSIRVRMGAVAQPEAGHAMVPRTHNVTLLVMVPKAYEKSKPVKLSIYGTYDLRHTDDGVRLPVVDTNIRQRTLTALRHYKCGQKNGKMLDDKAFSDWSDELTGLVTSGQWEEYNKQLLRADGLGCEPGVRQPLWHSLTTIMSTEGEVSVHFEVPPAKQKPPTVLPAAQVASLLDDGRSATRVQFYGGSGEPESARIEIGGVSLPASEIKRVNNELTLVFPSLRAWGVSGQAARARVRLVCGACLAPQVNAPLCASAQPPPAQVGPDVDAAHRPVPEAGSLCYPASSVVKPRVPGEQAFDLRAGAKRLAALDGAIADLPVNVVVRDASAVDTVALRVEGASLVGAEPGTVTSAGEVLVSADSTITLKLKNVVGGVPVRVTAIGRKGTDPVAVRHLDITPVERPIRRS
ncbi:hypothetical protein EI613_17610 [Azospirillum sp. 412522]|nr:hypothetical protein [Azospirillum sp. 412522]MBY6263718.1 hypothetical protein [Azospirillum sp. 412522]